MPLQMSAPLDRRGDDRAGRNGEIRITRTAMDRFRDRVLSGAGDEVVKRWIVLALDEPLFVFPKSASVQLYAQKIRRPDGPAVGYCIMVRDGAAISAGLSGFWRETAPWWKRLDTTDDERLGERLGED